MNNENLKNLIEGFFKNMKCEVVERDRVLFVDKIPQDFQSFYGKKSPYCFYFNKSDEIENGELVTKGSYIIKIISEYLETRGQATLLKMNFEINLKDEVKKHLKLMNCDITNYTKNHKNDFIFRFSFLTTFQYLNEKEQIMNDVYVWDGQIINFNQKMFQIIEGKKEEVEIEDLKKEYVLAKDRLKEVLANKINSVGEMLNIKLEKEIERIKEHYKNISQEMNEGINKNEEYIKNFEEQIKNTLDEKEKNILFNKINKLKMNIENQKNNEEFTKMKMEEEFFVNDEIRKHSLNINNKLINTTIIYYPVFEINAFLRSHEGGRMLNLIYNPALKKLSPQIKCESCEKEIKQIFLCEAGHLACNNCMGRCIHCGGDYCKNCLKISCDSCGTKLCRKCAVKCFKCGKYQCKSHMKGAVCQRCLNSVK